MAAPLDAAMVANLAASDVGPGPGAVGAVDAAVMFQRVCADHAPSFSGALAEIGSLPFTQHPVTGTWYHRNLDLSFKVYAQDGQRICSMVFGTDDDPMVATIAAGAAAVTAQGATGGSEVRGRMGTHVLINVYLVAP